MNRKLRKPARTETLPPDDEPRGNIIHHFTKQNERISEQSRLEHMARTENTSLVHALNRLADASVYDNTVLVVSLRPIGNDNHIDKLWLCTSGETRVEGQSAREALLALGAAILRRAKARIELIENAMKAVEKAVNKSAEKALK